MQTQQSYRTNNQGDLYLVPTPIGNLEDMTFRAINILQEVDVILAEDTRNTLKLLNHFEINTRQLSLHEHNIKERIPEIISRLKNGESFAQVSDAGMPSISDPGKELVVAAIAANINVIPLPGASAGVTALIASGIAPQPFLFYGFLERKPKEQTAELTDLKNETETLIFYEAPHRLAKTVKNISKIFGESRKMTLARELTKRYEEFVRGTIGEVVDWISQNEIRGEFVIIVAGNPHPDTKVADWVNWSIKEHVNNLIETENLKPNPAIKQVAKLRGMAKQTVYNEFHDLKE